ncbi:MULTISPECIES: hypothetical protein [unclassified Paenibacillus]|uniref:hypothetical protein n=1 Tax=unclassified Paenibacillus TaxID=185978 RepID=UPI00020D6C24|nr:MULTISPECIES: hypothetical protein [unclassified Paenibacillus]EGL15306.1 hypothetical protein HMPREF9413_5699 [Paenibacillus sp. HGF7]EPD80487.1 hypothetical protein HMPREF1207_05660 [Paenibacillus sp. HGH0039]
MQQLINGLKKDILEMIQWQNANPDAAEVIKTAIRKYRNEIKRAIEDMQQPPFEVGDSVELCSSSFEDSGLLNGDVGEVLEIKSASDSIGQKEWDVRVSWENGAEECWIGADNFTGF